MTDRPEPARLTREEIDDIEREARAWIDAIAVNPRERVFLQQGCELAEGALSLVAHVRALEADAERWKNSQVLLTKDYRATLRDMSTLRTKLAQAEAEVSVGRWQSEQEATDD